METATTERATEMTTDFNLTAGDIDTDAACGRCGDETPHTVFLSGTDYGYIVCNVCETERDWTAE